MVGNEGEPQAQELSDNDKLRWCFENLREPMTWVALGVDPNRGMGRSRDWIDGEIPEQYLPKVSMLYDAARQVSEVYDQETARAFLRSSNPVAGDEALILVIAQRNPAEAISIVNAAVAGFLG